MNTRVLNFFVLLIVIMAMLVFPRFDRQDRFGIDQYTTGGKPASVMLADAEKYINHVKFFRGDTTSDSLRAPWAYRPLPTYFASFIPFKPITAINIVNFSFLSLGLFFLLKTLLLVGVSSKLVVLGGAAYVVSFPVFFYGSIGYIDPVLVGMLCVGLYLMLANRNLLFFILLIAGAFVKDPYIIILPAWAVYQYALGKTHWLKIALLSFFSLLVFVGVIYLIRKLTPVPSDFFWSPNKTLLDFNLYRFNGWVSWLLTFGPFGMLAIWYCVKRNIRLLEDPAQIACAVGLSGALAIILYSFFSVYLDGRYIWVAYPFMIPLACIYLDSLFSTKASAPQ